MSLRIQSEPKTLAILLYDSRSGSTLFASLLNRYSLVHVSQEWSFISWFLDRNIEPNFPFHKLIDELFSDRHFTELGLSKKVLMKEYESLDSPITAECLIEATIHFYFNSKDPKARFWIVKHPQLPYLPTVINIFPRVKFLHLIRDGRAVFNSKRYTKSWAGYAMDPNLISAARSWRQAISDFTIDLDRTLEIRYEDLIDHADRELSRVLDFLGVTNKDQLIKSTHLDYHESLGKSQKYLHQNILLSPDPMIASRWKRSLHKHDKILYEWINADLLSCYGYELEYASKDLDFKTKAEVSLRFIYYIIQLVYLKIRNTAYVLFKERSFWREVARRIKYWKVRRINK